MKRLLLVFLFIISCMISVYAAQTEDISYWQKVDENNYINPEGIVGTEDVYGFSFIMKSYNKGQYEPVNGKNIWYTLSQYTIDCGRKKYKIGMIDSYGYEGNFVNGDYNKYAKFQPLIPETAVNTVARKLCRP